MSERERGLNTECSIHRFDPPAPGKEIVISGIAGRFPASHNVKHLQENLFNKIDLITDNDERWNMDHPDIPRWTGKVHNLNKFDADFFGVHFKHANTMDPMCRIVLEHSFEAVLDAGINPTKLRGTNTGVFIGACLSETEKTSFYENLQANAFAVTGCSRAMFANRISYHLGIHGPSYSVDSACSSSLLALEHAYRAIRCGRCDAAIVGGCSLCLQPGVSLHFGRLGVLSPQGRCRTFDENANGYVRSETIGTLFLQKAEDAKRIYATVVHAKTNSDGFKEQGLTYPSTVLQKTLFNESYLECGIDPNTINYMEAHGTGTKIGDPEEVNAIDKVFCRSRKEPLKIGSIKSNLGHAEGASGICSIAKVLIAMETGIIPPNLHYQQPREELNAVVSGRLNVISEPTPWEGGLAGVNSFGFGGTNVHVLLNHNPKEKINNGTPKDDLPRLVVVSGRTLEAVATLLNDVDSRPVDVEYVRLLHNIYSENITGYLFRGYSIIGRQIARAPLREITYYTEAKRPIWFVFSGMESQWPGMGRDLMRFPIFAKAIQKCAAVLKPKGIDIVNVITNKSKDAFDNVLNSFVGIVAIQIGLVDLLNALGIVPDNIIGHSVGELACAYADGCCTAEQVILSAYSAGMASLESKVIFGSMAVIGLGYQDLKKIVPPEVDIACHNSATSATISGPAVSVTRFVTELQAKNVFAKEVACTNIPYHSRYIKPAGSKLLAYLKQVIPKPKARSEKWISTSIPQTQWSTTAAKYSSAEYQTNNLLNSVLFEEVLKFIPSNAIVIEIAPDGFLQGILRGALESTVTNIALTMRGHADNAEVFLQAIGNLYNVGHHPQVANIYPVVPFPVSRGTPMISSLIKWDHSADWPVAKYKPAEKLTSGVRTIEVAWKVDAFELMSGHIIDGRNLLPATGYLLIVWETLAMMRGVFFTELPIVFEDVAFHRATVISKEDELELTVFIQKGSGKFEIVDDTTPIVSGYIRSTTNIAEEKLKNLPITVDEDEFLTTKDIYKELKLRGYQYAGIFRGLKTVSMKGTIGKIVWNSNWVSFMDTMMQTQILGSDTRSLLVPTGIRKVVIDTKDHVNLLRRIEVDEKLIPVRVYKDMNVIVAGGIEIHGLTATTIPRRKPTGDPVLEKYEFVAQRDRKHVSLQEAVRLCAHIALENQPSVKVKIFELLDSNSKVLPEDLVSPIIMQVLGDLPLLQPDVSLFVDPKCFEEDTLHSSIQVMEPKKLPNDGSAMMAIGYRLLSDNKSVVVQQLLGAVKTGGFLLIRDDFAQGDNVERLEKYGMHVILEKRVGKELIILARKNAAKLPSKRVVVRVSNNEFEWIEELKKILNAEAESENQGSLRLIVVGERDPECGVLGLVNCLRREPGGEVIRGVFIQDMSAPPFSLDNPLYHEQLKMDLAINVLSVGGIWGSYRHMLLPPLEEKLTFQASVKQMVRGDLSSLRWLQGPMKPDSEYELLIYTTHHSVNFRDVMLATGKIPIPIENLHRKDHDGIIGFEYSGVTATGQRFMGVTNKGFSNITVTDRYLRWPIPDNWSLEDGATVPVVYATCYYALYACGNMQKGEKILIHAGSGGVGQAAINLALHEGCEVFTTVGTPEKRKFIKETFPSIPDDHIGNSRDTSFEEMVMTVTKGRGVDIVLNSLAEEKLQASVRCLTRRGRFLEIGKFDLASNNKLSTMCFLKEIKFKGVMLDQQFFQPLGQMRDIQELLLCGLRTGAVKPLTRTIYPKEKIEDAFRYLAAGKHIGKVIIQTREDGELLHTPIMALPRFHCDEHKSYVILGGLGGFGMEFADWLILHDAKYIVLTSRTGVKNGYQRMRIGIWQSYGVKVLVVAGKDASTRRDCEYILETAEKLAPVDGIFNLAVVLKDNLFTNQTVDTFKESFRSKAWATKMLDEVSRKLCRRLKHFVVFSSVSCGRGNAGQTNYGMANSVMERICERRVQDGLPGLAIQWGAVGDVGLVADMQDDDKELVIGGTLQQKIQSCLEKLDGFLMQDQPVVASMVVAEKRSGVMGANNVVEAVLHIMGLKDIKLISPEVSLTELGMDSMMAVEIKQTLEREFEVFLTAQDIRNLNFAKLIALATDDDKALKNKTRKMETAETIGGVKLLVHTLELDVTNFEVGLQLNTDPVEGKSEVFIIPGVEGFGSVFNKLAANLKTPAVCFQLGIRKDCNSSIQTMARYILPHALDRLKNRNDFTVVGYSFGSLVAIELVRNLEANGMSGRLILIDGAPMQMKTIMDLQIPSTTDDELEENLVIYFMEQINPDAVADIRLDLPKCTSWEQRVDLISSQIPAGKLTVALDPQKDLYLSIAQRLKALKTYSAMTFPPINTPITLLKPTVASVQDVDEDYGLQKVTDGLVEIRYVEGNHYSMLNDYKVAAVINDEADENAEVSEVRLD